MTSPNKQIQDKAVDAIHKIQRDAKMCVFMLVDEDLEIYDDNCDITQEEKLEIYERFSDAMLENYTEILSQVVEDVLSER